jgi:hypothetical protein
MTQQRRSLPRFDSSSNDEQLRDVINNSPSNHSSGQQTKETRKKWLNLSSSIEYHFNVKLIIIAVACTISISNFQKAAD